MNRYLSYSALLQRTADVLERSVIPEIADTSARGQAWIAVGILNNVSSRLADPDAAAVQRILELLDDLPAQLDVPGAQNEGRSPADRLSAVLAAPAAGQVVLDPGAKEWMERCRQALTAAERAEVPLMRPTHYLRAMKSQ